MLFNFFITFTFSSLDISSASLKLLFEKASKIFLLDFKSFSSFSEKYIRKNCLVSTPVSDKKSSFICLLSHFFCTLFPFSSFLSRNSLCVLVSSGKFIDINFKSSPIVLYPFIKQYISLFISSSLIFAISLGSTFTISRYLLSFITKQSNLSSYFLIGR